MTIAVMSIQPQDWHPRRPPYGSTAALNTRYNGIYRIVSYKKL